MATVTLSDASTYPHGRPSYRPDPTVAEPIDSLGTGPFPGTELNIGQNGVPLFQAEYWRIRVEGRAPGSTVARLEAVGGALVGN